MLACFRVGSAARAVPPGRSYCAAVFLKAARLATSLSSCHATSKGGCEWVKSARAQHTHAPCLRPQLATLLSRGATRQRLLCECANAQRLHSPAAFFRAPPPRRSLLRREAPSHSARAADALLGTCLAKRIFRANWASGGRTSSTRTATNAARQQRASRRAAATFSVLSSRKGTGVQLPQANSGG